MMRYTGNVRCLGVVVAFLFLIFICSPVAYGVVYELVSANNGLEGSGNYNPTFGSGYVDVYEPLLGVEYGEARINYSYWKDTEDYWHYSYEIINNGVPTDTDNDFHFGWLYYQGIYEDTSQYDGIYKFSVGFNGESPADMQVVDSLAGSNSSGSSAWQSTLDPGGIGVDWFSTSPESHISPARWEWEKKGGGQWLITEGNNSHNDSTGEYFQIVSTWEPGWVSATIAAHEGPVYHGTGDVIGPAVAVIPEPATCLILGLAGLLALRRRS